MKHIWTKFKEVHNNWRLHPLRALKRWQDNLCGIVMFWIRQNNKCSSDHTNLYVHISVCTSDFSRLLHPIITKYYNHPKCNFYSFVPSSWKIFLLNKQDFFSDSKQSMSWIEIQWDLFILSIVPIAFHLFLYHLQIKQFCISEVGLIDLLTHADLLFLSRQW